MVAPYSFKDLPALMGNWPFVRSADGSSFVQASDALNVQASILGMVQEPSGGFVVGGFNFNLYRDVAGVPTATQITFTAGNKTLAEVISTINTAVGLTVAFNDNNFLRLTSPTIGSLSYLRLESISGSEAVFPALGLISETVSRGGELSQALHIDPSRGVAAPCQLSLGTGESLTASAINRSLFQLAYNAASSENKFKEGRRTRRVRQQLTADGERGIQIGAPFSPRGVYVGKTTTPTTFDSVRILQADGSVYTRDLFVTTTITISSVVVTPHTTAPAAAETSLVLAGAFGSVNTGQFIVFNTTAGGLESKPRRVISRNTSELIIEAADGTGAPITFSGTANIEVFDGFGSVEAKISSIHDTFSAPSTFGSRIEGVAQTVSNTTATVTNISSNNIVAVTLGTVNFTNASIGDLVVWTGASSTSPWSNNGTYRVKRVIDQKTIELMNQDYSPVILNPDASGGFGSITITTDGAFYPQPFLQLAAEGNPGSGGGAVPQSGETIIIEYYISDDFEAALQGDFEEYPMDTNGASISSLLRRFDVEHDDFGYSTDLRPQSISMQGHFGTRLTMHTDMYAIGILLDSAGSTGLTEETNFRTVIGQNVVATGEYLSQFVDWSDPLAADVPNFIAHPHGSAGASVWIGAPTEEHITSGLSTPTTPTGTLFITGDGTTTIADGRWSSGFASRIVTGFREDYSGANDRTTYWINDVVGNGTSAINRWSFLGLRADATAITTTPATDSALTQFMLHSNGSVGVNTRDSSISPVGLEARPLPTALEALRLNTSSATLAAVSLSFRSNRTTTEVQSFIEMGTNGRMTFALTDDVDPGAAATPSGSFDWRANSDPMAGSTGQLLMRVREISAGVPIIEVGANGGRVSVDRLVRFNTAASNPYIETEGLEDFRTLTDFDSMEQVFLHNSLSLRTTDPYRAKLAHIQGLTDTGGGFAINDSPAFAIYGSRGDQTQGFGANGIGVGATMEQNSSGLELVAGATWSSADSEWVKNNSNLTATMLRISPDRFGVTCFRVLMKPFDTSTSWTDGVDTSSTRNTSTGWKVAWSATVDYQHEYTIGATGWTNVSSDSGISYTLSGGSNANISIASSGVTRDIARQYTLPLNTAITGVVVHHFGVSGANLTLRLYRDTGTGNGRTAASGTITAGTGSGTASLALDILGETAFGSEAHFAHISAPAACSATIEKFVITYRYL